MAFIAPAQLITAPAQPPATGAAVYTALFSVEVSAGGHVVTWSRDKREWVTPEKLLF